MASPVYTSKTEYTSAVSASVYSFNHTSASNGIIALAIGTDQNGSETITGVTYDSVAMTKADEATKILLDGGGPNSRVSWWTIAAPNLGNNLIEITASGALVGILAVALNYVPGDHATAISASAKSFSDSGYAAPPGTHLQDITQSITAGANEVVLMCATFFSFLTVPGPVYTIGSGETERSSQSLLGANPRFIVVEKAGGAGGTISFDDTINTDDPLDYCWSECAISLKVGTVATYNPCFYFDMTVDHTKVAANETDQPILISGTFADLKTIANGGKVQSATGLDILPFDSATLLTLLPFELVKYDATTGEIIMWVKKTTSSTVDTTFALAFDDASVVTDQSNKNSVWRSTFKGAWHFAEASSPARDSTSTGADGTQSGGVTFGATGQVGKACSFDGTNDTLAMSQASTFNFLRTDGFSGMAWIKVTNNANAGNILGNSDNSGGRNGWEFSVGDAGTGMLRVGIYANVNSSQFLRVRTGNIISNNTWYHVAFTYSGNSLASGVKIYLNGVLQTMTTEDDTLGANSISSSGQTLRVGSRSSATNFLGGLIDEMIVEKVTWTANQITTLYNNQNSPSTFVTASTKVATGACFSGGPATYYAMMRN
jgi:hypothetical protein